MIGKFPVGILSTMLGRNSLPPVVNNIATLGAGSTVVPTGYNTLIAEVYGGGGAGAGGSDPVSDGGGGPGYSRAVIPVTPGATVYYNVGAGGIGTTAAGGDGGDSWVNALANVKPVYSAINWNTAGAVGGAGKGSNNGRGVPGAGSVGDVSHSGGQGGPATAATGGGGGGGADYSADGADSTNQFGGLGGAPGSNKGADGGTNNTPVKPSVPAGGGGAWSVLSGDGGNGKIKLTFLPDKQFLSARTYDTSGFAVGGRQLFDASRLTNGNLIYAVGRHGTQTKIGIAEVNPKTNALVFSYSDSGWAYQSNSANFTATRNTANQLTVSAVSAGVIGIGDRLSGTGIPGGTTITGQLSGTTGGVGVYTTSVDTTASASAIACARPAGPESVWKDESTGDYLFATVDGGRGNIPYTVILLKSDGTLRRGWNYNAGGDASTNRIDLVTMIIAGVPTKVVIVSGSGLATRRGITVLRYSDFSVLFDMPNVASTAELNGGAYRYINGVNYWISFNWNDNTAFLINLDTQTVVRTTVLQTGWDAKFISDDEFLLAVGFNGTIERYSGVLAWIASGTPPVRTWRSAIFSQDLAGTATPTVSVNLLPGSQQEMLVTTRSIYGGAGLVYQSSYGP